jgi:hypothetical protein
MIARTNMTAVIALVAGLAAPALAVNNSVPRALNGLPATDVLTGGFTVGLRGAAQNNNVTQQAWIGILEVDSDDRRTTNAAIATNGFDNTHPALNAAFDIGGSISDFAPGGGAAALNGGLHATGVAGIILSRDAANTGMASRARGVMGLSDDIARLFFAGTKPTPDPAVAADWSQMKSSLDYLRNFPTDVVNASLWYNRIPTANMAVPFDQRVRDVTQADLNGSGYPSLMFDNFAFANNKIFVTGAGNSGPGVLSLTADVYNGIVVGALTPVGTASEVRVATYSARGPLAGGRNGVMIVAPGSNITSTAWNHAGANPDFINIGNGTSYATPHVSGAAGILYSAGRQAIGNNAKTDRNDNFSVNNRLIKAVLLNSARKIGDTDQATVGPPAAWSPGAVDPNNNKRWTHPLNYTVGAGELDTNDAWKQYREATTITGPASSTRYWWDEDTFDFTGGETQYESGRFNNFSVPGGQWISSFTATLCFERHVTNPLAAAPALSNLDLYFEYSTDRGLTWNLILASVSTSDSTEHIFVEGLGNFGFLTIYRVRAFANNLAAGIASEEYALAVKYTTIPTPAAASLLAAMGIVSIRRRRTA